MYQSVLHHNQRTSSHAVSFLVAGTADSAVPLKGDRTFTSNLINELKKRYKDRVEVGEICNGMARTVRNWIPIEGLEHLKEPIVYEAAGRRIVLERLGKSESQDEAGRLASTDTQSQSSPNNGHSDREHTLKDAAAHEPVLILPTEQSHAATVASAEHKPAEQEQDTAASKVERGQSDLDKQSVRVPSTLISSIEAMVVERIGVEMRCHREETRALIAELIESEMRQHRLATASVNQVSPTSRHERDRQHELQDGETLYSGAVERNAEEDWFRRLDKFSRETNLRSAKSEPIKIALLDTEISLDDDPILRLHRRRMKVKSFLPDGTEDKSSWSHSAGNRAKAILQVAPSARLFIAVVVQEGFLGGFQPIIEVRDAHKQEVHSL